MPIEWTCSCGKRLRVRDDLAGKRIRCPGCKTLQDAPRPAAPRPRPPQPPDEPPVEMSALGRLLSTALASNPARVKVRPGMYVRCYPRWPAVWCLALLGTLALAVGSPLAGWGLGAAIGLWFLAGIALLCNLWYWFRVKHKFLWGDVRPAKVVSVRPYRVAVHTDLSKESGSYPVIKVLDQPLGRMHGGPPQLGDRLATAALYEGAERTNYWPDFSPQVVNCATRDGRAIARVVASIPEEDWRELEAGLAKVPTPEQPGMYYLGPAGAAHVKLNYLLYVRCFPLWPAVWVVWLLVFLGLALWLRHWGLWLGAGLGAFCLFYHWFYVADWCGIRFACPAKVVSVRPYRVAVYADLGKGEDFWPAIKVLDQPLERVAGGPPPEGARLAALASYEPFSGEEHWQDFNACAVNCVTRDERTLERVLASIPEEQWRTLEAGLARVPTADQPGLYKLDLPGASWEEEIPAVEPADEGEGEAKE